MAVLKATSVNGNITVNGFANIHNTSGRSTIKLVSQTDVPNDLYFGSNKSDHWSITSRESSDPYIGLYNVTKTHWTATISNADDTLYYHYNVNLDGALSTPGSTPLVSIKYNTSYSNMGDNGLNIIKFGNTDNYIGQAPASRSPNSLPGFAFHTSMTDTSSEFAWISSGWKYRMTLNTDGLSLYSGSVNIGTHQSNSAGDTTWLTLTPYRHTGGPWYIRNVDTSSDSYFQMKYGTSEIFKMKHDGRMYINNAEYTGFIVGNSTYGLKVQSANTGAWREGLRIYQASNNYSVLALVNDDTPSYCTAIVSNSVNNSAYLERKTSNGQYVIDIPESSGTMITSGNIGDYTVGNATNSNTLQYTGYNNGCFTVDQSSADNWNGTGRNGWATYLICNHGDGSSYYHQILALPFWGVPQYQRMEGGSNKGWQTFWTTENLSLNYSSGTLTISF